MFDVKKLNRNKDFFVFGVKNLPHEQQKNFRKKSRGEHLENSIRSALLYLAIKLPSIHYLLSLSAFLYQFLGMCL